MMKSILTLLILISTTIVGFGKHEAVFALFHEVENEENLAIAPDALAPLPIRKGNLKSFCLAEMEKKQLGFKQKRELGSIPDFKVSGLFGILLNYFYPIIFVQ